MYSQMSLLVKIDATMPKKPCFLTEIWFLISIDTVFIHLNILFLDYFGTLIPVENEDFLEVWGNKY